MARSEPKRTTIVLLAAVIGLSSVILLGGSRAMAGSDRVVTLHVGDSAFWNGEEASGNKDPLPLPVPSLPGETSDAGCDDRCIEYKLELAEPGARLRVAIDTPDCEEGVSLELVDPTGAVRAHDQSCYSAETYVKDPVKGTWIARVTSLSSKKTTFRMRAKLEAEPRPPKVRHRLLPNLRVEPPHAFSFDVGGPGLASATSRSCYEDEIVEEGAKRCLRFSVGPQNAGAGPLELKFTRATEVGTEASMSQRIYYNDGSYRERDAGSSEFHKTHGHFHLKGFAKFTLFRVTDRAKGTLKKVGTGHKSGFCLVDLRIAAWRKFNQQRAYSARSNCMPVGGKAELGLSAGWTDVYGYELPGNYVEFGDNPDGHYVVRTLVDSQRNVLESNESDNVGYAYINVSGNTVTLLERGRGAGPWDPNRSEFHEWWKS